ncbi:MAG TPA: sensor domain-containing diguanylate cyclase [Thermoanaerobaculia bacterium]|nr:sensor domain-containing diguanylate cyclase [Thermoanaerobaculia bacterium]
MQSPALPLDEDKRLELLYSLHLLDTPAEERFDRITRIARRLFDVGSSTISLIDSTREWFKSISGFDFPPQLARTISLSAHAIADGAPLVIEDASLDSRFRDNPLVLGSAGLRFFAALPVGIDEGSALTVLAVWDKRPRTCDREDMRALVDLAGILARELSVSDRSQAQIESQKNFTEESRIDELTRLWSRSAVVEILERELQYARRHENAIGVLVLDIDGLKRINDQLGHEAGDATLCEVARRLRSTVRPYDSVGRYGGEEFLILLPGADRESSYAAAERVRLSMFAEGADKFATRVTISIGAASVPGRTQSDSSSLIRSAETALLQAKSRGGNRVQLA